MITKPAQETPFNDDQIRWQYQHFDSLSNDELYALLALRSEVFVLEQTCFYADADFKDQACWHLSGWVDDVPVAYARIIPPGITFPEASIGRVLIAASQRKSGCGKVLMRLAIAHCFDQFNCSTIKISAQLYLLQFYQDLGFSPIGEPYMEDGIPHIGMLLLK